MSAEVPFWLAEFRKRSLAAVYAIEKAMCTFVGRPPRISRRFCMIELPMDADFEEIVKEGPERDRVLASLDPAGWNTDGKFRTASAARKFVMVNLIREEVLELSLGTEQGNIVEMAV